MIELPRVVTCRHCGEPFVSKLYKKPNSPYSYVSRVCTSCIWERRKKRERENPQQRANRLASLRRWKRKNPVPRADRWYGDAKVYQHFRKLRRAGVDKETAKLECLRMWREKKEAPSSDGALNTVTSGGRLPTDRVSSNPV